MPISGRQTKQEVRQRTVERAKQVCGSSYNLLAMRGCKAATAVEYCDTRPSCEGQFVCMGATPNQWTSAWSGKDVVEPRGRKRERDRRALVRPMLEWVDRGLRGS